MNSVTYRYSLEGVNASSLAEGFFEGWPNPPKPEDHFRLLVGSQYVVLAVSESGRIVGFITAVSDGVSCAYIPHLEVIPSYRGKGIGRDLVQKMTKQLEHLYMVDLCCDKDLQGFYEELGFVPAVAMLRRNYGRQACEPMT
jgi:ribosomal protein S18 acetylase RimI-like enzyme